MLFLGGSVFAVINSLLVVMVLHRWVRVRARQSCFFLWPWIS